MKWSQSSDLVDVKPKQDLKQNTRACARDKCTGMHFRHHPEQYRSDGGNSQSRHPRVPDRRKQHRKPAMDDQEKAGPPVTTTMNWSKDLLVRKNLPRWRTNLTGRQD